MKKMVNVDGLKSVRYHDSLSEVLVERIKKLYPIVKEVMPMSLDEWVDGFNYDMHPEGEIQIWEVMMEKFEFRCKTHGAKTKEEKMIIFKEILQESGANKIVIVKGAASA